MKLSRRSIDKLAVAAQNGEEVAWTMLHRELFPLLVRSSLKFVGDRDVAKDIAQQAFVNSYQKIEAYSGEKFSAWLYKMVENLSKNYLKKNNGVHFGTQESSNDRSGEINSFAPRSNEADYNFGREGTRREISNVLDFIPEPHKKVFIENVVNDRPYEEIAEMLDLPMGTVKARIHRARKNVSKYREERAT